MKYEKYLKQIAEKAIESLYWADVHVNLAQDKGNPGDNLFDHVGRVRAALYSIDWHTRNSHWLRDALKIPKSYVEKSKKTTAIAIFNEWSKENADPNISNV